MSVLILIVFTLNLPIVLALLLHLFHGGHIFAATVIILTRRYLSLASIDLSIDLLLLE